jgi:hypothetical protein
METALPRASVRVNSGRAAPTWMAVPGYMINFTPFSYVNTHKGEVIRTWIIRGLNA